MRCRVFPLGSICRLLERIGRFAREAARRFAAGQMIAMARSSETRIGTEHGSPRARDGGAAHASLSPPARWAVAFVVTVVAVAISYQWLDRPIAYFMHAHFHNDPLFTQLTLIPEFFAPLAVLAFIVLGLRALMEKPLTRPESVTLLCALSLVIGAAIKNQLKIVFGRTWPE